MAELIEPRLLKGFRDFLPRDERERQRIEQTLGRTFAAFGFEPIDTPILEYTEILLGKGGGETDKQIYRFDDQGGRDVAMRYDLTVPFARFMALHLHDLPLPFKRFHIAKVFRGENTQRGRYREFVQCDFDIVGSDSASADFEIVLLMDRSFRAIGVDEVRIHLSHRGVFNSLLAGLGVADRGEQVLRAVDKLRKIGEAEVRAQLEEITGTAVTDTIMAYVTRGPDNESTLESMRKLAPDAERDLGRLGEVLQAARTVGISDRIVLDPSITRGLDYYTGIVFETFLTALPEIGSVCSGGRYDNLASLYTKERLPGVGTSIGLDRLMAGLEELSVADTQTGGADAIVLCSDGTLMGRYHAIADELRTAGLRIDVFPECRKLGPQYTFAEKKGVPVAVIVEGAGDTVTVRELQSRTNTGGLTVGDAAAVIQSLTAGRAL
ncbi:MAG: histidine--tRNA ligase [Spirochaetales bacterium]|nr:histidine--tRNA ligase [Spirochaetales bacterium]